jgi:hypothetical protein
MYSDEQEKEHVRILDIIFERKYEIRIKKIDNMSIEEIEFYGMYSTGDKDYDESLNNEIITRWLSINEMVEYFKRGKPFSIVDAKNTEEIYEVIHKYLLSWKSRLENSLNIGNAPVEDLIALDSMASAVHGYACQYMKVQRTQSPLLNFFDSVGLGRAAETIKTNESEGGLKRHNSLAEIFSEAVMGYRR